MEVRIQNKYINIQVTNQFRIEHNCLLVGLPADATLHYVPQNMEHCKFY